MKKPSQIFILFFIMIALLSLSINSYAKMGEWMEIRDMPNQTFLYSGSQILENKIYVMGGYLSSSVSEYDISTKFWTPKPNMFMDRSMFSNAVANGKIYVFGGYYSQGSGATASVEEYDPIADKWTLGFFAYPPKLAISDLQNRSDHGFCPLTA